MLSASMSAVAAEPATVPGVSAPPGSDEAVRAYWTPERITHAQPVQMTVSGPPGQSRAERHGETEIVPSGLPTLPYDRSLGAKLYDDSQQIQHGWPPLYGTGRLPYTTHRLYPVADAVLYRVYPYGTVGHLYFHEPSGDYQCSASLIRLSTLATAGHCVNDGHGNYYTNWMFVPAQNGSTAPYGTWTWAYVNTTSAWYSGGGGVPNEQDDAVIVLKARYFNGVLHKLGEFVGYLGYEFNTPLPTAVTQLGYPCNLDNCSDPVATYSQLWAGPTNNFKWGSVSFGGASGGPEIQDFGQAPSGVPAETLGGNILVSTTSYTYASAVQVDGGSILYAPGQNGEFTFGDDLNDACSKGGC